MSSVHPADTAKTLVRRFARQRDDGSGVRATALAQQVRALLPGLVAATPATRVFLFGSLVWGGLHAASDVDLAVEGLNATEAGELAAAFVWLIEPWVDVVRLETAAATLRDRVLADGELLWSASTPTPDHERHP